MTEELKLFGNKLIPNKDVPNKEDIYLISLATEEEIERGEYVEFGRMKVSANPKRHGVIKDVASE